MNRREVRVFLIGLQASELYGERPSEHNLTFFSLQSLHKYPVHFNDFTRANLCNVGVFLTLCHLIWHR